MRTPQEVKKFMEILEKERPVVKIPLDHSNLHELLFATMLSAQATDVRVNVVTPALFKRFPKVEDYAAASVDEIREFIKSINFFNNKAKNIKAAAEMIVRDFGGKVPDTLEDLMKLPGVARKTANVVLGQGFHKEEGFVVDTHVIRLAQKYGFTKHKDPINIEKDMMAQFPQESWTDTSIRIILHGRTCCKAKGGKPQAECVLGEFWVKN